LVRATPERKERPEVVHVQSSIVTRVTTTSVAETVDLLKRSIASRGFTVFRVIDQSGTAGEVGVQLPE
jgi:uncharacterized protein (DUF302 family)